MENQTGRSMIEMLGVLAIVGILSVGGISAFQKAMTNHKLNKLVEEYTLFFQELQPYIKGICQTNIGNAYTSAGTLVNDLKILPATWIYKSNYEIHDSFNRKIAPFTRNKETFAFDYYMQNSEKDKTTKEDILLCQKIWADVLKPHAGLLYKVIMSRGAYGLSSYGEEYCNHNNLPCISERNMSEIIKTCESCGESVCVLAVDIKC